MTLNDQGNANEDSKPKSKSVHDEELLDIDIEIGDEKCPSNTELPIPTDGIGENAEATEMN